MPEDNKDKPSAPSPGERSARKAFFPRVVFLVAPVVLLAGFLVLLAIFSFQALPAANERIAAWTTSGAGRRKTAEPEGWEKVVDDARIVRMPYFGLLDDVKKANTEEPRKAATSDFAFSGLALNPAKFRGKLLKVRGQVIDVSPVYPERDPAEWEGVPAEQLPSYNIYQIEIVKMKGGNVEEKYFLHAIGFPRRLSPGEEVEFLGYFYGLYKGKEIELRDGGKAVVVAPLLVGRMLEPAAQEEKLVAVPLDLLAGVEDRTEISKPDEEAMPAVLEAMKSAQGVSDLTYFDMCANPEEYRGCVVSIRGEVARLEPLEKEDVFAGVKKYRRVILAIDKETPFTRCAAVYLSPDAPELKVGEVATFRGVFIKVAEMRGGRFKTDYLPLMASGEADTIVQAKKPEMNQWMKFLFVGTLIFVLIALFVATLLFTMIRRDRLKELQHHQALREITEKLKKQP